jgi:hypothetical protein
MHACVSPLSLLKRTFIFYFFIGPLQVKRWATLASLAALPHIYCLFPRGTQPESATNTPQRHRQSSRGVFFPLYTAKYMSAYCYVCVLILVQQPEPATSTPLYARPVPDSVERFSLVCIEHRGLVSLPALASQTCSSWHTAASTQPTSPHTAIYVPSYYYISIRLVLLSLYVSPYCYIYLSSYCYICVLILLDIHQPHTTIRVLILLYMCPHTAIYVSSYYYMCPHTTIYVSSHYYLCVLILLCVLMLLNVCPHTAICVASYYYMCVLIQDDYGDVTAFLREAYLIFLFSTIFFIVS